MRRFHLSGLACAVSALSVVAFLNTASAQSVACNKPTTAAERVICASTGLKAADEQMANAYFDLIGLTVRGDRDAIQQAQTAWMAERDRTCADKAKLAACQSLYERRNDELDNQNRAAQKRMATIVAGIPKDPKGAAAALSRLDGAPAKAWLVYLLHIGAVPVADKTTEIRKLFADVVENGLKNDRYLLEEMRNLGDVATEPQSTMLLFLRHVLSTTELDAPCFLFTRHGQAAFDAFGPFWGSIRDNTPELCSDFRNVYALPEWQKVDALVSKAIEPLLAERGGARYAYEREFATDALQASLVPSTLLETPHSRATQMVAETRARALAYFKGWKEFGQWSEADYRATLAALPSAIAATSKVYQTSFKLSASVADQAARAAADRYIASRFALLMPDE